jgi:glutamate-1-semialdehyde 2,1-aminomutase
LKTLELISAPKYFEELSHKTGQLVAGILQQAQQAGIPMSANHVGGMFGLFFTETHPVTHFEQVSACDIARFQQFFHAMLEAGIYLAPSAYEAGFVSSAHSQKDIELTIESAGEVLESLAH